MRFNRTRKCKKRKFKNKTMKNLARASKQKQSTLVYIHARGRQNTIPLVCPICKNDHFFIQTSMLRGGRWASFFDAEWLFDKSAKVTICDHCSHMEWFKDKNAVLPDLR